MKRRSFVSFLTGVLIVAILWGVFRWKTGDKGAGKSAEEGGELAAEAPDLDSEVLREPWGPYRHFEEMPLREVEREMSREFRDEKAFRESGGMTDLRQALIIRLAQINPQEAMEWVSQFFDGGRYGSLNLTEACKLVCTVWGHQDPAVFLEYIKEYKPPGREKFSLRAEEIEWMTFGRSE